MSARITSLDALRGFAVLLMIAYHAAWDLDELVGIAAVDVTDMRWVILRIVTASLFIFIAGVGSHALHARYGVAASSRASRHAGLLAVAAGLVSLATAVFAPDQLIFFGILHFLTVAALLAPLAWRLSRAWLALLAAGCLTAGLVWQLSLYPAGIPAVTPGYFPTLDYYPLLPWLGLFFGGLLAGRLGFLVWLRTLKGQWGGTAWLGRHALLVYLIHQPILIALGWLVIRAMR